MTVDNSFTMKKFQSMEIIYVTFSQITKLPYVECDPETFDDQVYMFTEEEAAKEFAKSYVEKNTPLLTVKVLRKQMPNFYMGLYAEGVNMVIFREGDQTRRIELEQIFPKPDMEKMNKQHLPVLNPGVQLTVVYFLQELRKPNQRRDDAERMQHLRELEEEMLVNLMRSKFILAIDISQVQGEFDPANPGPECASRTSKTRTKTSSSRCFPISVNSRNSVRIRRQNSVWQPSRSSTFCRT